MNNTTKLFFCLFFLGAHLAGAQQKITKWPPDKFPHDPNNCFHLLSNSYQCKWIFFGLKGIKEGTVIAYTAPLETKKPGPGSAYVSIVAFGKDTVRVLLQKPATLKTGDRIKLSQGRQPKEDLLVAFDRDFFLSEESKEEKPRCRVNEYDERVFKTTWGDIKPAQPAPATAKKVTGSGKLIH
jgi:hypothetical protein